MKPHEQQVRRAAVLAALAEAKAAAQRAESHGKLLAATEVKP